MLGKLVLTFFFCLRTGGWTHEIRSSMSYIACVGPDAIGEEIFRLHTWVGLIVKRTPDCLLPADIESSDLVPLTAGFLSIRRGILVKQNSIL